MTDEHTPAAAPSSWARLLEVLVHLVPYALVGAGFGLVFLPAGLIVPGLLWWWSDQRPELEERRPPAAAEPRGPGRGDA